jgi:hypothetical protein
MATSTKTKAARSERGNISELKMNAEIERIGQAFPDAHLSNVPFSGSA